MEIKLNQQSYTFHLASRLQAGSPGDYLMGEIILPPDHNQDRLTLSLSCVREDQDAPHPCYLHPLLFTPEGKRRRNGNEDFIDLQIKLNEEEVIEAFSNDSQQIGISIFVENEEVFIVAGQEKIIASKVENGKILLGGKHLRLGVVQPVTKSLKKDRKAKCQEVLSKLRVKVRCDGVNQVSVGFSPVVEEKLKKTSKEVRDLTLAQEGRKRKREETVGEQRERGLTDCA